MESYLFDNSIVFGSFNSLMTQILLSAGYFLGNQTDLGCKGYGLFVICIFFFFFYEKKLSKVFKPM